MNLIGQFFLLGSPGGMHSSSYQNVYFKPMRTLIADEPIQIQLTSSAIIVFHFTKSNLIFTTFLYK